MCEKSETEVVRAFGVNPSTVPRWKEPFPEQGAEEFR